MTIDSIPDTHFVDAEGRAHPLVVRHETGEPEFAVVDGVLVPFAEYRAPKSSPSPPAPMTMACGDGKASFNVLVS